MFRQRREGTAEVVVDGFTDPELIGRGATGRVYRARQTAMDREVALKVFDTTLTDEASRRRFEREVQLMGRLSGHPSIATVYDARVTRRGEPVIVMAYLAGGSVAALGRMDVADVLDIGVAIAAALDAAHQAGVLHRDVKPQNILLSNYGLPCLADFGLSVAATAQAQATTAGYTPAYAPPEVLESRQAEPPSDVYSLAASLYAMTAGTPPFADPNDPSIPGLIARILTRQIPDIDGAPEPLMSVLRHAMARRLEERTPTAMAFARDLQGVQDQLGLPRTATPTIDRGAGAALSTPLASRPPLTSASPTSTPSPATAPVEDPADDDDSDNADMTTIIRHVPPPEPVAAEEPVGATTPDPPAPPDEPNEPEPPVALDPPVEPDDPDGPEEPVAAAEPEAADAAGVPEGFAGVDLEDTGPTEITSVRFDVHSVDDGDDPDGEAPPRRRRWSLLATGILVVAGIVVALLVSTGTFDDQATSTTTSTEPTTAAEPSNRPGDVTATVAGAEETTAELTWTGDAEAQYQVRYFSEAESGQEQFGSPVTGTEATISIDPPDAGGYCFFVADVEDLDAALDAKSPAAEVAAFSDEACIRGATVESVGAG